MHVSCVIWVWYWEKKLKKKKEYRPTLQIWLVETRHLFFRPNEWIHLKYSKQNIFWNNIIFSDILSKVE